ncbi:MAG: cytochrome b/b6 domain-containing protein [Candidatus Hodarchaeota archaeon]
MLKTKKVLSKADESKTFEFLSVERYTKSHRLHHWVHVGSMVLFILTGFEIAIKVYFFGTTYGFTRTLHYILGIFVGGWDLIFYIAILIKDRKLLEIIPTPREILDLIIIALCAFRILPDSKYPHYDFYILEEKKYIMKYHPAQKLLALMNLVVIFLMGVTGIALAEQLAPGSTGILAVLALLVAPVQALNLNIRFLHFLMFVYFLVSTMVHFYFAIIPENRQRLRGMVTGKEKIPIQ